jgi:hypothetical protein
MGAKWQHNERKVAEEYRRENTDGWVVMLWPMNLLCVWYGFRIDFIVYRYWRVIHDIYCTLNSCSSKNVPPTPSDINMTLNNTSVMWQCCCVSPVFVIS